MVFCVLREVVFMESESLTTPIPESDPGRSFVITRRNGDEYTVIVDSDDYDRVIGAGKWCVTFPSRTVPYVIRWDYSQEKRKCVYLHRMLVDADPGVQVDHRSLNTLDNRKSNLRSATVMQNAYNRRVRSDSESGVKGISLHKRSGRWTAKIRADGKYFYIGCFPTAEAAAFAYQGAALLLHGEYARF
jgi:hypothetical protein